MVYLYDHAVLGGTFDHLHVGHLKLLAAAFAKSAHVTIGIVESHNIADKSYTSTLESYQLRLNTLTRFLHDHQFKSRSTIIPISDMYGTTLSDKSLEAIFVTKETMANANKINVKRWELNLPPLNLELIPYVFGSDGDIISSRRIREGIINREGMSYLKFFRSKKSYSLPDSLRRKLQTPIGPVAQDLQKLKELLTLNRLIITVGDIVSSKLLDSYHKPNICIIDHRTRRSDLKDYIFPKSAYQLNSPAGTINPQISNILLSTLASSRNNLPQIIEVNGEEDLLALPSILLAPLGSYVIYGQYDLGMVVVEVTEKSKEVVLCLLEQFN